MSTEARQGEVLSSAELRRQIQERTGSRRRPFKIPADQVLAVLDEMDRSRQREVDAARDEGYKRGLNDGTRIAHDQSEERIRLAELVAEKALVTDSFTGLLNQVGFQRELVSFLYDVATNRRDHEDRRSDLAVLWMIDVNHLKKVNDIPAGGLGHDVGNELILKAADLIKTQIRHEDYGARVGGDEFTVLQKHVRRSYDAYDRASRIMGMYLTEDWASKHPELPRFHPSVSIGVCLLRLSGLWPEHDWDMNRLEAWGRAVAPIVAQKWYRCADKAMYDCKEAGLSHPIIKIMEIDWVVGELVEVELEGGARKLEMLSE